LESFHVNLSLSGPVVLEKISKGIYPFSQKKILLKKNAEKDIKIN
jgi:hypothetical protein